jgi:hypothetical protein
LLLLSICNLRPFKLLDTIDQDGCAPCDPGSFAPHPASTECGLCPSSQFADKPGMDKCDSCADLSGAGMITTVFGASTRQQCMCPSGTWVNAGEVAAASPNATSIWLTERPDFITTMDMIAQGTSDAETEMDLWNDDLGTQTELAVVLPTVRRCRLNKECLIDETRFSYL